jgi:hypothetical protein
MTAKLAISRDSELFGTLSGAARQRRCVFWAGLPGVGKSLLLQQLAIIAVEAGRTVHLLQWDIARAAFETPEILARYPEQDGVTHPAIRKAVGLWAREGIATWDREHADDSHLLIGETPLIGNRLIELAQVRADLVESLLAGDRTLFLVPAPTQPVRAAIEGSRDREMSLPAHERELANASLRLVRANWRELRDVAQALGTSKPPLGEDYDPDVYVGVYRHVLRHRHAQTLSITKMLQVEGSAQELPAIAGELSAEPQEVSSIMGALSMISDAELTQEVENWYRD